MNQSGAIQKGSKARTRTRFIEEAVRQGIDSKVAARLFRLQTSAQRKNTVAYQRNQNRPVNQVDAIRAAASMKPKHSASGWDSYGNRVGNASESQIETRSAATMPVSSARRKLRAIPRKPPESMAQALRNRIMLGVVNPRLSQARTFMVQARSSGRDIQNQVMNSINSLLARPRSAVGNIKNKVVGAVNTARNLPQTINQGLGGMATRELRRRGILKMEKRKNYKPTKR